MGNLKDVVFSITGDNTQGGQATADAIANAIKYTSGQKYQVVAGLTSATAISATATTVDRLKGFKSQLASKYPGIELVDTASSRSMAPTPLARHPPARPRKCLR